AVAAPEVPARLGAAGPAVEAPEPPGAEGEAAGSVRAAGGGSGVGARLTHHAPFGSGAPRLPLLRAGKIAVLWFCASPSRTGPSFIRCTALPALAALYSHPMKRRPSACAITPVVPEPRNGSITSCPSFEHART